MKRLVVLLCAIITAEAVVYEDCLDANEQGQTVNGLYDINPDGSSQFQVYCDMLTDDGGWTVIQRRQDGSQDFFLNWNSYVAGFGDKNGEHWLGLDKILKLANSDSEVQLRIDMTTDEEEPQQLYARYKSFYIGDASTHYALQVSNYIGDAGDSLGPHNTHRFSTKDNGDGGGLLWNGAWWFHNTNLHSHLNGEYNDKGVGRGVVWWNWRPTGFYHLTFTEMKVRRKT